MGDGLATLPISIMGFLGFHESLHHTFIHSTSLDIFTSHIFKHIHTPRESRQVLHTFRQWRIFSISIKYHTINVDEREGVMSIILQSVEHIATVQVYVDNIFLMQSCHEMSIVLCQDMIKFL